MTAMPVVVMIALVPLVPNDYALTIVYLAIIGVSALRYTREDIAFLAFGFCALLAGEYLFLLTGVESFTRHTLFGVMPLWLPFLWAYVFVAIKRGVVLFGRYSR